MSRFVVAALYKFVRLDDYQALREPLLACCNEYAIKGTLLLAAEGINGTIAGSRESIDAVLGYLKSDARFASLEHKESFHEVSPFKRMKIKLKREIVTMGVTDIDPARIVGTYVDPKNWNALIADPDVTVIDTRNDYEYKLGTFERAIDPNTKAFGEFPAYVARELDPQKHKKVAMFCTGGIRCEKSTAYLLQQGFEEVYHLKGGILKYLEDVPAEQSLWRGECYVFDDRVAVDHSLSRGRHDMCFGCGVPVREEDKAAPLYELGVSCPACAATLTDAKRAGLRERQRQYEQADKIIVPRVKGASNRGV